MSKLLAYGVNTNISGVNGFGRQPANTSTLLGIWNTDVANATDTTLTVPSSISVGQAATDNPHVLAIFSYQYGSTVFVADGSTAAPDASGTFVAKSSVINPTAWIVNGGDVLHFYPIGASAYVSVEFYSIT